MILGLLGIPATYVGPSNFVSSLLQSRPFWISFTTNQKPFTGAETEFQNCGYKFIIEFFTVFCLLFFQNFRKEEILRNNVCFKFNAFFRYCEYALATNVSIGSYCVLKLFPKLYYFYFIPIWSRAPRQRYLKYLDLKTRL